MALIGKRSASEEVYDESQFVVAKKKGNGRSWLILTIIVIIFAVAAYFVFTMVPGMGNVVGTNSTSTPTVTEEPAKASGYKAVFLVNNQVYFGKIVSSMGSQFITLEEVYYLQVQQDIQPTGKEKDSQEPNISLVKLGGELHGPTNAMQINRDQILLVEDLRTDSNLVAAIENYASRPK